MTTQKKLQILDDLNNRLSKITYHSSTDLECCEDDIKTFIRHAFSLDSQWIGRVDSIRWSPSMFYSTTPDSVFVNTWNSGKTELLGVLASIKSEIQLYEDAPLLSKQKIKTNKVFIVHGHNDAMKLAVERVISQLGLAPIILHEQPNKGRTTIEKFERVSEDVSFAVVLLSADDKIDDAKYRARQNVILELGYFIAKLGRDNVVALYEDAKEIELPSDISGVLYEPYDKPDGAWRFEVVQELKAAGFNVDANALT